MIVNRPGLMMFLFEGEEGPKIRRDPPCTLRLEPASILLLQDILCERIAEDAAVAGVQFL